MAEHYDEATIAVALAAISAANAADPRRAVDAEGADVAVEILYARRMSGWVDALVEQPSPALRLATRAFHLERWVRPRDAYPLNRAGYHRWKAELQIFHAARAGEILTAAGCADNLVQRVQALIRKRNLGRDAEVQVLEDAASLIFIEHQLIPLADKAKDDEKVISAIQKTWAKMSEAGRAAALTLALDDRTAGYIKAALDGTA